MKYQSVRRPGLVRCRNAASAKQCWYRTQRFLFFSFPFPPPPSAAKLHPCLVAFRRKARAHAHCIQACCSATKNNRRKSNRVYCFPLLPPFARLPGGAASCMPGMPKEVGLCNSKRSRQRRRGRLRCCDLSYIQFASHLSC